LSNSVKITTETARDPLMMSGLYLLLPSTDLPSTIGSTGRIHGASIVRIPAINETISNVIMNLNIKF